MFRQKDIGEDEFETLADSIQYYAEFHDVIMKWHRLRCCDVRAEISNTFSFTSKALILTKSMFIVG